MSKILIIEDDGDLQQLLGAALFREGLEVHYAFNGKEGYDKILSLRPDLILLDLMLPVLPGVEVIRLVISNTSLRDIPIIVMTAHGDNARLLERSVKAQGVREYIRKPFEIRELVRLIRRILAQYPSRPQVVDQIAKGTVRLDKKFRTAWVGDRHIATLPPILASLLAVLLESPGPVRRDKLLQEVWGKSSGDAALAKAIQRLREEFGDSESRRIQTTHDGYELIG